MRREERRAARRQRRRGLRRGLALLLVVLVVLAVAARGWIAAEARTAAVLVSALDIPVAGWVLERVTAEPRRREITLAGAETTMVRPGGDDEEWPALVFLTGASPAGRHHPRLLATADGLARAGYVVYIPDVSGLREGELGEATLDEAARICLAAARRAETAGGRVALASVSAGASLALLAAAQPALEGRVTAVAGIAPYADLRNVLRSATTGTYRTRDGELERFTPAPYLRVVVARSLLATLPARERALLEPQLDLSDESGDPLAGLREDPPRLPAGGAQAVVRLLANRDPARFDELYEQLPASTRARLAELSPLEVADRLTMPIELATAPRDKYFPPAESRALARAAPDARVTVTGTLQHAIPEASPRALRDLWRFHAFVVRFVRESQP